MICPPFCGRGPGHACPAPAPRGVPWTHCPPMPTAGGWAGPTPRGVPRADVRWGMRICLRQSAAQALGLLAPHLPPEGCRGLIAPLCQRLEDEKE